MVGVNSISVVYRVRRPLSTLNGVPLRNFPAAVGRKVVIKLPYKSKFEMLTALLINKNRQVGKRIAFGRKASSIGNNCKHL